MRKLNKDEVAVCRSTNKVVVVDGTGRKFVSSDPLMINKTDEQLKQQFKCFNVMYKGGEENE